MKLTKHHGLHNDFLIVLDEANHRPVVAGPDLARQLCDRRSGIGADGLIHGTIPAAGSSADVVMNLWNADGSRAEMSGNGLRCLAQAVARHRGQQAMTVMAETDVGLRELALAEGHGPDEATVEVDMGTVKPGPDIENPLPFMAKEAATASLGNPHLVAWVEHPDALDLAVAGPIVEAQFPDGINLELIAPGLAPNSIELTVWERGAGITQACGTGACAATYWAAEWGLIDGQAEVTMPGGSVRVELVNGRAVLTGPAVYVADIEVADD